MTSKQELKWASAWGVLFCVLQILVCLVLGSRVGGFSTSYFKLNQWDSFHYIDIIDRGYQVPQALLSADDVHSNRANVGYFPGFPAAATIVKSALECSTPVAILITAQFCCLLFWVQLLLLLRHWGVSRASSLKSAGAIAVFPASFFLVTGYSESLFIAALIGLIYWTEIWLEKTQGKRIDSAWMLAALSGFILSGTRLVGIPLMVYPLLRWIGARKPLGLAAIRVALLSGVTALGGAAFFGFCQLRFGHWDLYLQLQKLGWGNEPNYLAIFDPRSYIPRFFFEDTSNSVCRASNLLILLLILFSIRAEMKLKIKLKGGFKVFTPRLGLYVAAFSIFFVCLSGKANYHMDSMVRYNLPVFALLVLALVQGGFQKVSKKYVFFGVFLALAFQVWMILVFTKGGWVA